MQVLQIGMSASVSGESRIAWEISEREHIIMKRLEQEGGESNAKDRRADHCPEL